MTVDTQWKNPIDRSDHEEPYKCLFTMIIAVVVGLLLPLKLRAYVFSHFSCVRLFATPWTVARQAPLSIGFCRQEYWSGLPFPPPGDLPNPGTETEFPVSPALQASFIPRSRQEVLSEINVHKLCNKANQYLGWHF